MTRLSHQFARFLPQTVFACALGLAALPTAAQTAVATPAAADASEQALILRAAERVYTRELFRLSAAKTLNTDAAAVSRVRSAADPVIRRAGELRPGTGSWQWSANVETSAVPLLYCLPGGRILVSTGLLDRVRPNPGELSALLAHAIAHALDDRDGEEAVAELAQRGAAVDPDPNRVELALGESLLKRILDAPRQPAAEQRADALALEMVATSAQDPRVAPAAWRKVATLTDTRPPAFPALHPATEDRTAAMESLMPAMLAKYDEAKRNQVPPETAKSMPQARQPKGARGEGRPIRK